tara:strand:- start:1109 stop:1657 length:549 start_codon:yes stop_codon:yes gene_type:complete
MGEVSGGLLLLVKKELIENNCDNFEYKNYECQDGDYLNILNKRGYQKINIKFLKKDIIIYNTHLNCIRNKCKNRENQIEELLKKTENEKKVILLGDFNTIKEYDEINLNKYNFIDTIDNDKDITWDSKNHLTNILFTNSVDSRIDYIFIKNCEFENSKIIFNNENTASDHYGVMTEISLKNK